MKEDRTITRYKHFFGFQREPFSQDIKVEDLYPLTGLKALADRFLYALELGAISVITGEVGTGKSTSLRYASTPLHPFLYWMIRVTASTGTILELLRQILLFLQIESRLPSITFLDKVLRTILSEITGRKQEIVLIIDEANLMRIKVFSQLHTPLQLDFDFKPLVSPILCGQETLLDKLMYHTSSPLASHFVGRSHLEGSTLSTPESPLEDHGSLRPALCRGGYPGHSAGTRKPALKGKPPRKTVLVTDALEKKQTDWAENASATSTGII